MAFRDEYFSIRKDDHDLRLKMQENDFIWLRKNSKQMDFFLRQGTGEVLDLGCSDGNFLVKFRIIGIKNLYGVEINSAQAITASKNGILIYSKLDDFINTQKKPQMIISRGVDHYLSQRELIKVFSLGAHEIIFLQSVNFGSLFVRRIRSKNFRFIHPDQETSKVVQERKIPELVELANSLGYRLKKISYPYLSTPYRNLLSDLVFGAYAFVNPRKYTIERKYLRAFPGNVFRCIFHSIPENRGNYCGR